MSRPQAIRSRRTPAALGVLLREPVRIGNALIAERLVERGHPEIRPPHNNVFQFLDPEGTRVSVLAERAAITKQSMAELVAHLERHGYVERVPDPTDGRAKLVRSTERGREVYAIAGEVAAEMEADWTRRVGRKRMRELRNTLAELNESL
jgi:DNA-binding MarR family transcriptional regulator